MQSEELEADAAALARDERVTGIPSNTRHSVLLSRDWPGSGGSSKRVHPCISFLLSITTWHHASLVSMIQVERMVHAAHTYACVVGEIEACSSGADQIGSS